MRKRKNRELVLAVFLSVAAVVTFVILFTAEKIPVERPEPTGETVTLENWSIEESALNGKPLEENKAIYPEEPDTSIYDVYLSVFPTKDENGDILVFDDFEKHTARDHTYNPTLNCNIQILEEGEYLDPLLNLDNKNATIRVRGNSSRGDLFKSYKIKLSDEAKEFYGQDVLNLNKHSEDLSKITTKFCTDILTTMDNMVSYRTNFMRVWIRDTSLPKDEQEFKYYGLYTHTEQPNKKFLERRNLSSSCEMYKARDFSFQLSEPIKNIDDPDYSELEFETVLGIREASTHEGIIEMVKAVNDEQNNFEEVFAIYFNEENYLTWLAFNLLVGGQDILNHNFILYRPMNGKTWYFFPWDFDSNMQFGKFAGTSLPPSLKGGQKLNQVVLHKRFFRIPGNIEKLEAKMKELIDVYFTKERTEHLINLYLPILDRTMSLDPDIKLLDMKPSELVDYVCHFYDGIKEHYNDFVTAFQYPAPMFVSQPKRLQDGKFHFSWDTSYSYQGRTITYNLWLANDCFMKDVLYEKKGIIGNSFDASLSLEPGTYYLKVTAVDSEGFEQVSLEHYEFYGVPFIYESGVLEVTID